MMDNKDFISGFDEVVADADNEAPLKTEVDTAMRLKRPAYFEWEIKGRAYKLKLTSDVIVKLEQKFKRNLITVLTDDGLPPLSTMLTVVQASMQMYQHGITYYSVQQLYDAYVEDGGDQLGLLSNVIMPLMSVSGFFTETQAKMIREELKTLDMNL